MPEPSDGSSATWGFLENSASQLAFAGVSGAAGFLTSVLLARWLSAQAYGFCAVILAASTMVAMLVQLGWGNASTYRLRRRDQAPGEVLSSGIFVLGSLAASACLVAFFFRGAIRAHLVPGAHPSLILIGLCLVPSQVLGLFGVGVARGLDRFDLSNRFTAGVAIGTLVLVAFANRMLAPDAAIALGIYVLVSTLGTLALLRAVAARTGFSSHLDSREIARTLRFGAKTYAQATTAVLHEQLGIVLVASLLHDGRSAALYALAASIVNRTKLFSDAIASALFAHLAGLEENQVGSFAARTIRHVLPWIVVVAAALGLAAAGLLPLIYGQRYADSVPLVLLLLPGACGFTLYLVVARYFMALGRQGTTIAIQLGCLALNVGLNLWWVPRFDAAGAALASLVSYSVLGAASLAAFCASSGHGIRETLRWSPSDREGYRLVLRRIGDRVRAVRPTASS